MPDQLRASLMKSASSLPPVSQTPMPSPMPSSRLLTRHSANDRSGSTSTRRKMAARLSMLSLIGIVEEYELYGREKVAYSLLFVQIFAGNIILRHLVRANFLLISVPGVFDARHYVGLERVSFIEQLVDTLRIRTFDAGQSLQISRLPARTRSRSLR